MKNLIFTLIIVLTCATLSAQRDYERVDSIVQFMIEAGVATPIIKYNYKYDHAGRGWLMQYLYKDTSLNKWETTNWDWYYYDNDNRLVKQEDFSYNPYITERRLEGKKYLHSYNQTGALTSTLEYSLIRNSNPYAWQEHRRTTYSNFDSQSRPLDTIVETRVDNRFIL
ncbi:MAG: hypothetical protein AB8F95_04645, partial [Bacteroidia bacterium]